MTPGPSGVSRRLLLLLVAAGLAACATPGPRADLDAGVAAIERGDAAEAAERWEAALAAPGPELSVRERIWLMRELGEVYLTYLELGRELRARELFAEARALADSRLPPGDPVRLAVLGSQGNAYAVDGQWADAVEPLEKYLEESKASTVPEDLYRLAPVGTLIDAHRRLGNSERYDELVALRDEPLRRREVHPVAAFEAAALYAAPGTRRPPFAQGDMPLRVALGRPRTPAAGASEEETARAVARAIRRWESQIQRVVSWFRVDIVDRDPGAHIQVEWRSRGLYFLPAVGVHEQGVPEPRGRLVLATQPIPDVESRIPPGELWAWSLHAFGAALGLPDCYACDSIMSMGWLDRSEANISDLDLRTLEALVESSGDGETAAPPPEAGVLASLPIINTGRAAEILIDLAPPGKRPLPVTLDTGAADTVLTPPMARAWGVSVRRTKSDEYRRATATGEDLRFWVTSQGGGPVRSHFEYALLGGEFLRGYVVELDFPARRVRLLDPEVHAVGGEGADGSGEQIVELELAGNRPYAPLSVGNGTVLALVDTGAMAPLSLTEEKATELGVRVDRDAPRRHYVNVLGTSVEAVQRVPQARIGDVVVEDVELLVSLRDESSVRIARFVQGEALIGLEVLQRYRVRFDYPRSRMGLTLVAP